MPSGMLNDLEFEKRIKKMKNRELLEFVARQTLETNGRVKQHEKRLTAVEGLDRKMLLSGGGIGGVIGGIMAGFVYALLSLFGKGQ